MKKILILVLVFSLALALVACGGGETPDATSGTDSGSDNVVKDTLIIGHYGDTPNFDTHNNLNDNGMRINLSLYDPLVRMDNTTYEILPCIAESWDISDDGTEYTFKIKKGVKFSDGTDMQLSDVLFSLQRGMEMPLAVPSFARVKNVELAGEDAVKITLDGPYPEFLFAMSLPTAGILSEAAVKEKGEDFSLDPVTTGPYKLVEWRPGEKVLLTANEYYHMGIAPIKNVEYRVIPDPNAAVISLESGDIDAYVDVPQTSYTRINNSPNLELHQGKGFSFMMIQLNTSKAPFDNLKVRQAIAYATDKEAILHGIMDGDGLIVDTCATPEYLGYTDAVAKYPYDLEKAKALLEEAGYPNGFETEILAYTDQNSKIGQVVQNSLAQIGINADIKLVERAAFDEACIAGQTEIIMNGTTFTAPTIDEAIYVFLHSSQFEIRNYSRYENKDVDKYFDEARVVLDDGERAALYQKLLVQISEDVPVIPTIWRYKNIATNKDLKGVSANPWAFYNLYDFSW